MSNYFKQADPRGILQEYPIGEEFNLKIGSLSKDQIKNIQEQRFLRLIDRAWSNPFYFRRWSSIGLDPNWVWPPIFGTPKVRFLKPLGVSYRY